MAPVKVLDRHGPRTGQFSFLTKLFRRRSQGTVFGCYVANLAWVKQEVRHCRQRRLREERREALNQMGAFI